MSNKYVEFVSDAHFLSCVKWVCDAYPKKTEEIDMHDIQKNVIDPFKMTFDISTNELEVEDWVSSERTRQRDKTINNKIGEFHQKLLGGVRNWKDLGVGDDSKVDLKKEDNSIFIELKNKHNTMNSDATDKCFDKLRRMNKKYPNSICYWAYIIGRNGTSGDMVWKRNGIENEKIRKIYGKKVYELITGDSNSLEKTWIALPIAISDLKKTNLLSKNELKKIKEFFDYAFH